MTEEQKPETVPITNERGEVRQYETVASRLLRFRAANPAWSVQGTLIDCDDEVVRMRVDIGYYTDAGAFAVLSSGHAEEYRMDGQINQTSALENCETSALGRALAFLGFGSANSIASAEEVIGAKKKRAVMDERAPGALILLQNAAKQGDAELSRTWKEELTKDDRVACQNYMPALKRQAAQVDRT
jgi:hypothetical protein